MEQRRIIKSVKNTLNILNCFSLENPEIRVTDISKKLGLSKSTVSRLLFTLEQENLVAKISTNQRFRLGSKVLELASIFLSNTKLRTIALPYLKDLQNKTGEMASIFIIDGCDRICIENVESSQEVRPIITVGTRYPLHAGSAGKLLLAFQPKEKRREILSKTGLPRFRQNTITNSRQLENEMNKIRREGYALSNQERALYVSSVSTPIRDFRAEVVAALCLSTVKVRFKSKNGKELIDMTKLAANRISKEFGYIGSGKDSSETFKFKHMLEPRLLKGNK